MAFNVNNLNLAKFNAASAGTGSFVVSGPVTGYQTPLTAGASNFNYHYRAESADLTQWEIGLGTYTSSTVSMSRSIIINSVGGTSAINFTNAPIVGMGIILTEDIQGTGQILGTTTNDSAATGNVGEYVSATLGSSVAVALTTTATSNLTSLSLTAGDWDVHSNIGFFPGSSATVVDLLRGSIGTSSNAIDATVGREMTYRFVSGTGGIGNPCEFFATTDRFSSSISFTVYLNVNCFFTVNTLSAYGRVWARRAR